MKNYPRNVETYGEWFYVYNWNYRLWVFTEYPSTRPFVTFTHKDSNKVTSGTLSIYLDDYSIMENSLLVGHNTIEYLREYVKAIKPWALNMWGKGLLYKLDDNYDRIEEVLKGGNIKS